MPSAPTSTPGQRDVDNLEVMNRMQWLLSKQSQEILDASLISANSQIRELDPFFRHEEPSPGYYQINTRPFDTMNSRHWPWPAEMRFNGEVSWSGGEMAKGSATQSVTRCSSSPEKPLGIPQLSEKSHKMTQFFKISQGLPRNTHRGAFAADQASNLSGTFPTHSFQAQLGSRVPSPCFAGMGREKEKINLLDVCFEGIEITCQPDKTAYESELEV
ncbi:hypothetical protein HGM15179_014439 [Zosterops borbonicus]|uniref:Uncharacterized protein n=1 Tax=Zosterops borbonicus TaxID=364589 RepID=A0A8K1LG33_9PASS|nr:hypothetical protein HGM15179_014439 [Zosterops borbonicus]